MVAFCLLSLHLLKSIGSSHPRVLSHCTFAHCSLLVIIGLFLHHFNNVSDANPFDTFLTLASSFIRFMSHYALKQYSSTINHFLQPKRCVDAINFSRIMENLLMHIQKRCSKMIQVDVKFTPKCAKSTINDIRQYTQRHNWTKYCLMCEKAVFTQKRYRARVTFHYLFDRLLQSFRKAKVCNVIQFQLE